MSTRGRQWREEVFRKSAGLQLSPVFSRQGCIGTKLDDEGNRKWPDNEWVGSTSDTREGPNVIPSILHPKTKQKETIKSKTKIILLLSKSLLSLDPSWIPYYTRNGPHIGLLISTLCHTDVKDPLQKTTTSTNKKIRKRCNSFLKNGGFLILGDPSRKRVSSLSTLNPTPYLKRL